MKIIKYITIFITSFAAGMLIVFTAHALKPHEHTELPQVVYFADGVSQSTTETTKLVVGTIRPIKTPTPKEIDAKTYSLLTAVIYYEARVNATLEEAIAVGWVAYNRSQSAAWGKHSMYKQLTRKGQFSTLKTALKNQERIMTSKTQRAVTARKAARYVLEGREVYRLPTDVQYFHGNEHKRRWGKHKFYKVIGGNAFFRRVE